jgi:hypothetical protein
MSDNFEHIITQRGNTKTNQTHYIVLIIQLFVLIVVCAWVPYASAETITLNQQVNQMLKRAAFGTTPQACGTHDALSNPNISITYGAYIVDPVTNTIIPRDGSVLTGSEVILRFKPQEFTDIYWFGTGYTYDSPYGEWSNGTPPLECNPKDLLDGGDVICYTDPWSCADWVRYNTVYVPFVVRAPSLTFDHLNGLSCGPEEIATNGARQRRCTVTESPGGQIEPRFEFGETTGRFYFRADMELMWMGTPQACHYPAGDPPLCTASGETYVHQIDKQEIRYTLNISGVTVPPAGPQPLPPPSIISVTPKACGVYDITVRGTDPDGKQLRYWFDSDADSSADIPLPGDLSLVPSDTQLTLSKYFDSSDPKIVRLMSENEDGIRSSWVTWNTPFPSDASFCNFYVDLDGSNSLSGPGLSATLDWNISGDINPEQCVASGGWYGTKYIDGGVKSGSEVVTVNSPSMFTLTCTLGSRTEVATHFVGIDSVPPPPSCVPNASFTCTPDKLGMSDSCTVQPCPNGTSCVEGVGGVPTQCSGGPIRHSLNVEPPIIRAGSTVTLSWETPTACSLSGNGSTLNLPEADINSMVSTPINHATTFILDCLDPWPDISRVVRVIPIIETF